MSPGTYSSFVRALALCAACAFAGAASAQIIQTNSHSSSPSGLSVLNNDLLQTNLASVSSTGGIGAFGGGTLAVLSDGLLGTAGAVFEASNIAPTGPSTITFRLDTSVNTLGYNITNILTTASWDTGRDGQGYSIFFSSGGSPETFTHLLTITPFNPTSVPSDPSTTQVSLSQTGGGPIATGVFALRFDFTDFENNGTAFREFDVVGSAVTIPEPGTLAIFAIGLLSLTNVVIRRRQRKA